MEKWEDQYNKIDLNKWKTYKWQIQKGKPIVKNDFKVNGSWEKLDNNMEKMNSDLCLIICYKFQMY